MGKIAVTGETGFVGSTILSHLREAGHDVIAITRDALHAPCQTASRRSSSLLRRAGLPDRPGRAIRRTA